MKFKVATLGSFDLNRVVNALILARKTERGFTKGFTDALIAQEPRNLSAVQINNAVVLISTLNAAINAALEDLSPTTSRRASVLNAFKGKSAPAPAKAAAAPKDVLTTAIWNLLQADTFASKQEYWLKGTKDATSIEAKLLEHIRKGSPAGTAKELTLVIMQLLQAKDPITADLAEVLAAVMQKKIGVLYSGEKGIEIYCAGTEQQQEKYRDLMAILLQDLVTNGHLTQVVLQDNKRQFIISGPNPGQKVGFIVNDKGKGLEAVLLQGVRFWGAEVSKQLNAEQIALLSEFAEDFAQLLVDERVARQGPATPAAVAAGPNPFASFGTASSAPVAHAFSDASDARPDLDFDFTQSSDSFYVGSSLLASKEKTHRDVSSLVSGREESPLIYEPANDSQTLHYWEVVPGGTLIHETYLAIRGEPDAYEYQVRFSTVNVDGKEIVVDAAGKDLTDEPNAQQWITLAPSQVQWSAEYGIPDTLFIAGATVRLPITIAPSTTPGL